MFAGLHARCALHGGTRVLEIGCGTGQATRPLAALDCTIHCVEIGTELAELARRNLAGFPGVQVEVGAFEDVELADGGYDLVFSATAFHWIDPAVSYARAARVLGTGGHLALATNTHVCGGTQDVIAPDVRELHQRFLPEIGAWQFPSSDEIAERAGSGGDLAHVWARIDRSFGEPPDVSRLFSPPSVSTYEWTASYDRDGYLAMLATQSSYVLSEPEPRGRFLHALGELIDARLDGRITKNYVAVLAIATKRS